MLQDVLLNGVAFGVRWEPLRVELLDGTKIVARGDRVSVEPPVGGGRAVWPAYRDVAPGATAACRACSIKKNCSGGDARACRVCPIEVDCTGGDAAHCMDVEMFRGFRYDPEIEAAHEILGIVPGEGTLSPDDNIQTLLNRGGGGHGN